MIISRASTFIYVKHTNFIDSKLVMDKLPQFRNVTFPDGGTFEGFTDPHTGGANGFGICTFIDGSTYDGNWVQGIMEGIGTITFGTSSPSFHHYTGDWKGNKFEGVGSLVYRYEAKYEGQFKAGKMDGYGRRSLPDKTV